MVEVDPEPYGDAFARPARLLPVEAKALIAAIDLIGEHIPEGSLASVRSKVVAALGEDPAHEGLQIAALGGDDKDIAMIVSRRSPPAAGSRSSTTRRTRTSSRRACSSPTSSSTAWRAGTSPGHDPSRDAVRHFRLDRIKSATVTDEQFEPNPDIDLSEGIDSWLRTGEVKASRRARVWFSPERARWAREERNVISEGSDGSVVAEVGLRGPRLARARGAQGGRRRGRAGARRGARRGPRGGARDRSRRARLIGPWRRRPAVAAPKYCSLAGMKGVVLAGRQGDTVASAHEGDEQAPAADLRQAADLLPAAGDGAGRACGTCS